jgi:trk system potassium uptake protein TrkA
MNIIITGAGKVGFNLAKTLSISHNVTIIDKNLQALKRIQELLDIMTIEGNVEDSSTYIKVIDKDVDLFIAVTNDDNSNLISILMANHSLNIRRKFVRLHHHFYNNQALINQLGIDEIIFPRKLTSKTIGSLLDYPKINNIKSFKYTDYKLISLRINCDKNNIFESNTQSYSIIGIERGKEFFIPDNCQNVNLQYNDLLYIFTTKDSIKHITSSLDKSNTNKIEKCVIFGGKDLGISIGKTLIKNKKDVKLIEKDLTYCHKADQILKGKASVINMKYDTTTLFEDEALDHADLFIAATNDDEYNIVKCLEAKDKGIKKIIAINNELEYYNLMHTLGLIVSRGPKINAYNTIMERINSTKIVIKKNFCGGKASVYMRKIFPNSHLINKTIKPIKNSDNILLFFIRDNNLELFNSKITLKENDLIVIFCHNQHCINIENWIYEL